MLIRFTVENWMSFRDPVTFSMIASRERQHGERIPRVKKYGTRILPVSAIYGGNASGKSNLIKALSFAKNLVAEGTKPDDPIAVEPFRLDSECIRLPSKFIFELLINEVIYEFSFSVTQKAIVEEELTLITSSSEKMLYKRTNEAIEFEHNLMGGDIEFIKYVYKGTRENQLFLNNGVSQKVDAFRPVYNWFKNQLILLSPDRGVDYPDSFMGKGDSLFKKLSDILPKLDTGINYLGSEEVPTNNLDSFVFGIKSLKKNWPALTINEPINYRYFHCTETGKLIKKKLVTYHNGVDGQTVRFELEQESDGTKRLFDLIPAFLGFSDDGLSKVYIIDEIDRSLHTLLTWQLLEVFLSECSAKTRSQLIFTTHDLLLMDQKLFRRDEMWVTERDFKGVSNLFSFSEYMDIRYDKDIRKSYLQGRLGGIPRLVSSSFASKNHNGE